MTESVTELELATDFEPATREQWLKLVDKAIKGADFEKRLVSRTADGLRIEPLYTRADALAEAEAALPGSAPFTRGTKAAVQGLGWQIVQPVTAADPAAASRAILEELEGGANGVALQIEAPGQSGVRIRNADDMTQALHGVYLDFAPVELKAGLSGPQAARHFLAALPQLGVAPAKAIASLNVDPLGGLARFGTLPHPVDEALADVAALAAGMRSTAPGIKVLRVDGTVYHEAGASEGQELAAMAATLVAYLRAFEAKGFAPADVLAQTSFALSVDADIFYTIAKLRAARRIIWRIADASGAGQAAARTRLAVVSSERMMAKRDPWTNMLRTCAACTGAALGGADAITVLPFTWPLGKPDAFARRIARNIQIVCQEESSLGRVIDPTGGSWYIEKLTDELTRKAWELFQGIEQAGGLVAALHSGLIQDQIAAVAAARAKAIATGRQELTGTSAFPLLGEDGVKVEPHEPAPAIASTQMVRPLTPHRLAEPFEMLRDAADAHAAATRQPLQIFLASLGAVIDHTVRSTWVKNYLAAGGIAALTTDGYRDAEEAATAFKASGATAACICSSDALYAEHAEATATALKAAGAQLVLIAGRPGGQEAALKAAGVDGFLFAGADAVATLKSLQGQLGVQ